MTVRGVVGRFTRDWPGPAFVRSQSALAVEEPPPGPKASEVPPERVVRSGPTQRRTSDSRAGRHYGVSGVRVLFSWLRVPGARAGWDRRGAVAVGGKGKGGEGRRAPEER